MNRSKKSAFRRKFTTQVESLETRILLAGDTVSALHNVDMPNDVNGDQHVSPIDLAYIVMHLKDNGPSKLEDLAAAEPGSTVAVPNMVDTNNDGFASAIDAFLVLNELNGNGEGETFRIRPEITDANGNVVTNVDVDESITLSVYVQDLRGADAAGIFSAYTDVTYDPAIVSVPSGNSVNFGNVFADGNSGNVNIPGLIDEVGGFDQTFQDEGLADEQLLFQLDMTADAAGTVTFATDPADVLPIHEFIGWDAGTVTDGDIEYGSVTLTVGETVSAQPDLVAFAEALDANGVTFWSTQTLNADAVQQRALFEDGANYLPAEESLDANGNLTSAATTAGVTAVNTWIFADNTQATGVLTLEEIAQRSGVDIPLGSEPTLLSIADNNELTVQENSPLHIPLDGYDPDNEELTYTVTVDDPSLVEPVIISGNRSWSLDIEGYGELVFELFEGRVPRATDHLTTLSDADFYDTSFIYRVIDDLIIQGGDASGTGDGISTLPNVDDQYHVDLSHNKPGVLSLAKRGDDNNNALFFVTDAARTNLDFAFTIAGHLVEGYDVLDAISAAPVDDETPLQDIVINDSVVFNDQENAVLMLRALDSTGTTNVTVTVTDSQNNSTSETFQVDLAEGTNKNPFLNDIAAQTARLEATTEFQLSHFDVEGDDVVYTAELASGPANVGVSVSDTGLVSVDVPNGINPGEIITVLTSVRQTDRTAIDEQTVELTIAGDVTAVDDTFDIDEDTVGDLPVLVNDARGTLVGANVTSVTQPAEGGTVEIAASGQRIFYTPPADFPTNTTEPATVTFTYTVTDSLLNESSTGTVTVNVNPVVDPPIAVDDVYPADLVLPDDEATLRVLREDSQTEVFFSVLDNDSLGPDLTQATITAVSSDTGTVRVTADGTIGYLSGDDVFGADSFTYTYTGDNGGPSASALVTVNLVEVNDAPVAADDTFEIPAGQAFTIPAADLLANDTPGPREDAQTLTISSVVQPNNGSVTLNQDGSITIVAAQSSSAVQTFEYTIMDDGTTATFNAGTGQFVSAADPLTATGTVSFTVTTFTADDTYVVANTATPAPTSLDVLANDLESDLTITATSTPSNGTVQIVNDGKDIEYTPGQDFFGEDSFTYTATNSAGGLSTATVNVTVQDFNRRPTANDDSFSVTANSDPESFDVLANDVTEEAGETIQIDSILVPPSNGIAAIANGEILYLPNQDFVGEDTLVYEIIDSRGAVDAALVTITVTASNTDPTANDDVFDFASTGQTVLDVLDNDSTTDTTETLTITEIVTPPTRGTATIASDGLTIIYEPINETVSQDTLTYRISDGNGGTALANVTLTDGITNAPPVANPDVSTGEQDAIQIIDVLENDTAEANETLTIEAIVSVPMNGSAEIISGQIRYTPDSGFAGTDSLTYRINDGNGGIATADVNITVTTSNVDPVANNDSFTLATSSSVLDLLSNDLGQTGETLTITSVSGGDGNVTISNDGTSVTYTRPNGGQTTDSFIYTIDDGTGRTDTATVSLTLAEIPDTSFFGGSVFHDRDSDGQRDLAEAGIGGVTVTLEGTDDQGNPVQIETTTDIRGEYVFTDLTPGSYVVTQAQPAFLAAGSASSTIASSVNDDQFEFQVIAEVASGDNRYSQRGLAAQLATLETLSSWRGDGALIMLDSNGLAWIEDHGGWGAVDSLAVTRSGDNLTIQTANGEANLSMTDRNLVKLIGAADDFTLIRVNGSSQEILSAAAVDAAFTS